MRVPPHYQYNFGNHGDKNLAKLQRKFDQSAIEEELEAMAEPEVDPVPLLLSAAEWHMHERCPYWLERELEVSLRGF